MQQYRQSAPLTVTLVITSTVLVLAGSLALITATLFILTHLQQPQIFVPGNF